MALIYFFSWWYTRGWGFFLKQMTEKLQHILDAFSIPNLLKTLFRPFRQISANERGRTIDAKIYVFFDKLVSRFVGFFARFFLIIAGIICIVIAAVFFLVFCILWPFLPLAPVAGIILTISGFTL